MIYTITLNPALDHYLEVEDFLMDDANRVKAECLYAGGKGIDVSRAIRRLGGDSMALGFIGGHNGRILVELLKREGVTTYFTPIRDETRRDVIISARRTGAQTLLHAQGPAVTRDEWQSLLAHLRLLDLREAYVALGGSLPRGVPVDAYRQIVALVQQRGAKAILDADGPALKAGLKAKPFAIKPNLHELQRVTGRRLRSDADILAAAGSLSRRGVPLVIVSLGPRGLIALGRGPGEPAAILKAIPPVVRVKSRVGAGDSTVAGFVFRHAGGKGLEDCLRFATACGTAATLAPGNQLCRLADAQRLAPAVRLERIDD